MVWGHAGQDLHMHDHNFILIGVNIRCLGFKCQSAPCSCQTEQNLRETIISQLTPWSRFKGVKSFNLSPT
jgi:hypothetical protein